jgi:hypothetical protein
MKPVNLTTLVLFGVLVVASGEKDATPWWKKVPKQRKFMMTNCADDHRARLIGFASKRRGVVGRVAPERLPSPLELVWPLN